MHTKYTTKVEINKVRITFTSKKITAYGGFSLLALFFNKIKFREVIEAIIPVKESSPNSIGIYSKILAYILTIYAGGNRFTHLLYLGCQEILSEVFSVKKLPLASTSLTRLFKKIKKMKEVEELSDRLWAYTKGIILWEKIKEDWLTFDSTVLERYGKQEGVRRGYNPKKKGRGSHSPLLAFLNRSKYVIHLWNRAGNVGSWNNILGFYECTWERIKGLIEIRGVIADSGFYLREFIEKLEEMGLTYIITAKLYYPLQRVVYSQGNWQEVESGIWITEFSFKHPNWDRERRYIAIRQDIKRRPNSMGKELSLFGDEIDISSYRFSVLVTNSKEPGIEVWKQCRPRANDENTLKELKEDFALGGFCMKHFYSTEAAMLIRILIYNLFVVFRHELLGNKEKTQRLKTLRFKYFVLPAQLGSDGKKKILRISVISQEIKSKLIYLFNRIIQHFPDYTDICNAFG